MKPKEYNYYIDNNGQAIGDVRLLYKKVNGVLWVTATVNEGWPGGWILSSCNVVDIRPISDIIAETFWPNLCKCSPKE